MKIIGRKSLLYWLRFPFAIYVVGFILSSVWIISLCIYYLFTKDLNKYITIENVNGIKYDYYKKVPIIVEKINFHYPFSGMAVQTDNSILNIIMAVIGLLSVIFILLSILYFIINITQEIIFTSKTINSLNILGYGLIFLGIVHIIIEYLDKTHHYGIGTPFLGIIIGIIILMIKEVFVKGKKIQEENDLTI